METLIFRAKVNHRSLEPRFCFNRGTTHSSALPAAEKYQAPAPSAAEGFDDLSQRLLLKVRRDHQTTRIEHKSSSKRGKRPKNNRVWTKAEDLVLGDALMELVQGGYWKTDNTFRSGELGELEKILAVKLPASNLLANPYIESRVKTLKKQALAIYEMVTLSSGFAWDDEKKCIDCERSLFDDWVKSHPATKGLYWKAFLLYDTLVEVYAKDRAIGGLAETAAEVAINANSSHPDLDLMEEETDHFPENIFSTQDISFPEPSFPNAPISTDDEHDRPTTT